VIEVKSLSNPIQQKAVERIIDGRYVEYIISAHGDVSEAIRNKLKKVVHRKQKDLRRSDEF
jgi:hypothetical protein